MVVVDGRIRMGGLLPSLPLPFFCFLYCFDIGLWAALLECLKLVRIHAVVATTLLRPPSSLFLRFCAFLSLFLFLPHYFTLVWAGINVLMIDMCTIYFICWSNREDIQGGFMAKTLPSPPPLPLPLYDGPESIVSPKKTNK